MIEINHSNSNNINFNFDNHSCKNSFYFNKLQSIQVVGIKILITEFDLQVVPIHVRRKWYLIK